MRVKGLIWLITIFGVTTLFRCGDKPQHADTHFTKTDSLTDSYLALQDSLLEAWNVMIHDDNHKLEAMKHLIHEIRVSGSADPLLIKSMEQRLQSLKNSRYTQKTLSNADIVEEYDFASNALIAELITLAESQRQFAYNTTLQKLVDQIRTADQRVMTYRENYDAIANRYNAFVAKNKQFLKEVQADSFQAVKPLFRMADE